MQKIIWSAWAISILLLTSSCGNNKKEKAEKRHNEISIPKVPAVITDPQQKTDFLIMHYWDNFDFTDTAYIWLPDITEQAFAGYITLFSQSSPGIIEKSIGTMLDKARKSNKAMYNYFVDLFDKYFYDPNSPWRQEEYYIPVLQHIIRSDKVDELEKVRPRYRLEMALKNRVGTAANDFTFTLANGKKGRLSTISSFFVILFFNNPDCPDCVRVKEILSQITDKNIKIVAIYPDNEVELWRHTKYPDRWINGYNNTTIRNKQLYDLKAIPCLYLLDKDKKVILKDVQVERLLQYLYSNE